MNKLKEGQIYTLNDGKTHFFNPDNNYRLEEIK